MGELCPRDREKAQKSILIPEVSKCRCQFCKIDTDDINNLVAKEVKMGYLANLPNNFTIYSMIGLVFVSIGKDYRQESKRFEERVRKNTELHVILKEYHSIMEHTMAEKHAVNPVIWLVFLLVGVVNGLQKLPSLILKKGRIYEAPFIAGRAMVA